MADGPNIEKLFIEKQALNAQSNERDIVRQLRFYKDETAYQAFLKHYLPMFAKPEYEKTFNEFIDDLDDKELAKELKKLAKPEKKVEPKKVEVPVKTKEAAIVKAEKEVEKKFK